MNYYDMHSHILPGVDDGAGSVKTSLKLINMLVNDGVMNISLTPHFYTNQESLEDFLVKRNNAFEELKNNIPKNVSLCLGAEVYVTQFLFNNLDLSPICYGASKYILSEFPYHMYFDSDSADLLFRIKDNYGLIPVIPHVERYENLFSDEKTLEELVKSGIVIQTNVSSFTGFLQKRRLIKYINNGLIHILGTDSHSVNHGNPEEYIKTCKLIQEKCGKRKLEKLQENAAIIFNKSN